MRSGYPPPERLSTTPERHPGLVYNRSHPHDTDPANVKFLLVLDGEPIGTTRFDPRGEGGIVRLVGIVPHLQRHGHGSVLEERLVDFAVGFYEKLGWSPMVWDEVELATFAKNCVQMTKGIAA